MKKTAAAFAVCGILLWCGWGYCAQEQRDAVPPAAAQRSSLSARAAGMICRGLSKSFIAASDIEKMKKDAARKIAAMDTGRYRRYYADIYEHTEGWEYLARAYNVRKDMPKDEALAIIRRLDKEKLYTLIATLPDDVVVRAYRRYTRLFGVQGEKTGDRRSMSAVINGMIVHVREKYCGQ